MPLAIFGINNTALSLAVTFAILALVAIWIALIVFTFIDARRRISDPFLVGCATAASFFPFVGTIVYTILRPAEFLEDVRERETEMKSAEAELRHLQANSCHKCGFPSHPDYVRCPACRSRLKEPCPSCERPVGLKWKVCPYCEHTLIASKRSKSPSKGAATKSASRASSKAAPSERRSSGEKSGRSERQDQPRSERSSRSERAGRSERKGRAAEDDRSARPSDPAPGDEPPRRSRRVRRESSADAPEANAPERSSSQPSSSQSSSSRSSRRRIVVDDDTEVANRPINSGESVSPAPEPERG